MSLSPRLETLLPTLLVEKARQVLDANRAAGRTIAVAESCTGGLVAAALTEIPGSSDTFLGGVVTYANEAKSTIGVDPSIIETFGAVSLATGWAMANGILKRSGADVAVAITGVAGPGGGSDRKPVGTVVLALAEKGRDPEDVQAHQRDFGDLGRGGVRLQAALAALDLLIPATP